MVDNENDEVLRRRVGERIRRLRELRGWSMRRLAAAAGITHVQISNIEQGKSASIRSWRLVARALGVQFGDLTAEDEQRARELETRYQAIITLMQRQEALTTQRQMLDAGEQAWTQERQALQDAWRVLGFDNAVTELQRIITRRSDAYKGRESQPGITEGLLGIYAGL